MFNGTVLPRCNPPTILAARTVSGALPGSRPTTTVGISVWGNDRNPGGIGGLARWATISVLGSIRSVIFR